MGVRRHHMGFYGLRHGGRTQMIGGDDHIVRFKDTPTLRRYVEQYGRTLWPGCVVVKEDLNIWHFFKDVAAKLAWEKDGGTPDNQPLLFTVYFGDETTVVTGPGSPIGPELSNNIELHWCFEGFVRSTS